MSIEYNELEWMAQKGVFTLGECSYIMPSNNYGGYLQMMTKTEWEEGGGILGTGYRVFTIFRNIRIAPNILNHVLWIVGDGLGALSICSICIYIF